MLNKHKIVSSRFLKKVIIHKDPSLIILTDSLHLINFSYSAFEICAENKSDCNSSAETIHRKNPW